MNANEIIKDLERIGYELAEIELNLRQLNSKDSQFDYTTSPSLATFSDRVYFAASLIDKTVYQRRR